MEPRRPPGKAKTQTVRCLDCGTTYDQPLSREHAASCPTCGYVGWIQVSRRQVSASRGS